MSFGLGCSPSEIGELIDGLVKLIIVLKKAPAKYQSIVEKIESGKDIIEALKRKVKDAPDGHHTNEFALLNSAVRVYSNVIQEFDRLAKKYPTLESGALWSRFRFLARDHFHDDVAHLEQSLQTAESSIQTSLGILNMSILLKQIPQEQRLVYVLVNRPTPPSEYNTARSDYSETIAPSSPPSRLQSVVAISTPRWIEEPIAFNGEMKIWFKIKINGEQADRVIESICVEWSPETTQKRISMIYRGKNNKKSSFVHTAGPRASLQDTLVPQMGVQTNYLKGLDGRVEYIAHFLGCQEMIQASGKVTLPICLEYSFTDETDFIAFQCQIHGDIHKLSILVSYICMDEDCVTDNQVLQVWASKNSQGKNQLAIRFFRNQPNYQSFYDAPVGNLCPPDAKRPNAVILEEVDHDVSITTTSSTLEILFYTGQDKKKFLNAIRLPYG